MCAWLRAGLTPSPLTSPPQTKAVEEWITKPFYPEISDSLLVWSLSVLTGRDRVSAARSREDKRTHPGAACASGSRVVQAQEVRE